MNHSDLRALAAVATPGPWFPERSQDYPGAPDVDWILLISRWQGSSMLNTVGFGDDEDTARYVAAVSPDVVVGLLDEIDRLRARLEKRTGGAAGRQGEIPQTRETAPRASAPPPPPRPRRTAEDRVPDLMADLEQSVAQAKEARTRHGRGT